MNIKNLVILLSLLVAFSACRKQIIQPPPDDLGYSYQPLTEGHFVIYDVDSIIFNDFTKSIDTFTLQLKDEIGESFTDDEGRESHYVNRYRRTLRTDPWVIDHVFYITRDNFKLEWKEDNQRYIKMVYPVKLNKKWKGNTFLPTQTNPEISWLDDWDYRYTDVVTSFNTGVKTYKTTHVIDHADFIEGDPGNASAFSARTYSREVFADKVGMVYREVTRWEYQPSTTNFRKGFTTIFRARSNN